MLYIHNFETNRWPGGNPETGYLDTDGGPTKTEVLKTRFVPSEKLYWQLNFGKLSADQLLDVSHDPDCLRIWQAKFLSPPYSSSCSRN